MNDKTLTFLIEVIVDEESTTADLNKLKENPRNTHSLYVAQKVHEALNLYKGDFVHVIRKASPDSGLAEHEEEEPAYRRQVDYVAEKQKQVLKILPPDDPWEDIGYTGRPGPAETWDK
jgi:hypothetical protein